MPISPYISEGSGLKHDDARTPDIFARISPYISEGSGLKLDASLPRMRQIINLPLHQ